MPKEVTIRTVPEDALNPERQKRMVARKLGVSPKRITHLKLRKRSIDARRKPIRFVLQFVVWVDQPYQPADNWKLPLQNVTGKPEVHIVGLGPAGLFAALRLIELGVKPVVIERGKAVRPRRRDLALLNREGTLNPESNYCFGEGGAGTFSDGKLYTRSGKRGDLTRVLHILHQFGASEDILIDSHPHIGTNLLPGIIQFIREQIIACGGEVLFETRLTGIHTQFDKLAALELDGNRTIPAQALILATGHSARDIFELLHHAGIAIHAKPFALGVRVEHPQSLIDQIQYRLQGDRPEVLPPAAYSVVSQEAGRGVYSFCMCPGGIICPAATDNGEIVVNGWSPSKRNNPYANSGMVVSLELSDFDFEHPLSAMEYQKRIEQCAFQAAGGQQVAPAQRLTDFVVGKPSQDLPGCSYLPGVTSIDLREVLPELVHLRLQKGFKHFGDKLKGYLTEEAIVVGVESRTSSPVRIPRDKLTRQHPQVAGLFPCGEGAGYAGGIMSAAIDGEHCATAAVSWLSGLH
ncbi:MAG: FAD-dependent protein [Bacteroidota bacterium]